MYRGLHPVRCLSTCRAPEGDYLRQSEEADHERAYHFLRRIRHTTTHNRADNARVTRCSSTDEGNPRSGYVGIRAMIPDIRARQPCDGPMKCGTQPADMSVIIIVANSCSRIA